MRPPASYRTGFIVLSVALALAFPLLSFDFGITEDEQLHNQHGKSILDYFLGRSDLAARNPVSSAGQVEFEYDGEMNDLSGALNIYGGFFDLLCATTHRYLSPLGEFENRHFVNSLFGVLLVVFTGLTAARVAGWRAGVLALLLMALSPRIVGHSMNNPVDLPFAALYMFSLYFMIRYVEELPRPARATWIPLLIGIPLATDVRIAGLVLIFYLAVFVSTWCVARLRAGAAKGIGRATAITAALGVGSYLLVSALWPFAHRDPLTTPVMALQHLSRLETFNAYDLFEGAWIDRWEIPWYFVPKWLLIGTPLFVPLGLLLTPFLVFVLFARSEDPHRLHRGKVALLAFAFLFPVLFVILRRSNVYNDARHVLFAYPALAGFCAVVFESVLRHGRRRLFGVAFSVLLAGCLIEPLFFMVRNHPNEGVYFSPLIGGVKGSWARYETDFWGNSVREAVEWIQARARPREEGPVRVRLWYGDQTKASYYLEKKPGFEHVVAPEDSTEWDYKIMLTVECKHFPEGLFQWPPHGTVYEVRADDTPLCAVVRNPRGRHLREALDGMRTWAEQHPTHANYYSLFSMLREHGMHAEAIRAFRKAAALRPEPVGRRRDEYLALGVELQERGLYEESVLAARLALRKDPASAMAFNNLCAAQIELGRWSEAIAACERALDLQPEYPHAANNLARARTGAKGR